MRSRLIAGFALVVLAMGLQTAGAAAKKPLLWLDNTVQERVPAGAGATLAFGFAGCFVTKQAHLATNGRTSDAVTLEPGGRQECASR